MPGLPELRRKSKRIEKYKGLKEGKESLNILFSFI
jgi:hypothetical protein